MKRCSIILVCLLAALAARAVTPQVGKDRLRQLVKLPTVSFQPDWKFDPTQGFSLGSGDQDTQAQIERLRKDLKNDDSDAESEQRLAQLYLAADDVTNSRDAWQRSAEYFRKRVDLQPQNAVLLSGFGTSLDGIGRATEAGSVLRRAVETAPREWRCQLALGRFLDDQARRGILERPAPSLATAHSVTAPAPDRPSADVAALAQKWLDEADDCFDQAVTAAPREPEVYLRRGLHRCLKTIILNQIQSPLGTPGMDPLNGVFSPESLADLQHASRLAADDYRLIGATTLFEIYAVSASKSGVDWSHLSWNSLPTKSQATIREALVRLEDLSQSADPEVAAGSLEVLGILEGPILHESDRSITSLQRAVALQPTRQQSWEVLVATLAQAGRFDDLLAVCEDQVKYDDSPRSHLMLAKAHEKLQQWEDCEEEAREAVADDPNDVLADLSLGALLLKRSHDNADVLAEANDWLTRAENALKQLPPQQRSRQEVIDLTLTRGIYFALSDDLDTARKWVQTVIDRDKENKLAREILDAMNF